jgi:hypothetical protein
MHVLSEQNVVSAIMLVQLHTSQPIPKLDPEQPALVGSQEATSHVKVTQ